MPTGRKKAMARKKSDPPGMPPRIPAVTVKSTPEWKAWLEEASDHCRDTVAGLVDKAVAEYVKTRGFDKPPPRR